LLSVRYITSLLIVSNFTAFDPKPFIRTFEAAVDSLIAIRKDVQSKTEKQEKSVQVAEREYSKKMVELNKGFEVCMISLFWEDLLFTFTGRRRIFL